MAIRNKEFGTLVGDYGKGIENSGTVNFSVSGGKNCDTVCSLHPVNGGGCYAVTAGARKPSITVNLLKKQENFSRFLEVLVKNSDKIAAKDWVRFSAFGSIPKPSDWTDTDRENLRKLAEMLDHRIVHFPVETIEKADALTELGFTPRVSTDQADQYNGKVSKVIMGTKIITGRTSPQRARELAQPAFDEAEKIRAEGRTAMVCPAILSRSKCGKCKGCGANGPDVVIYPRHV